MPTHIKHSANVYYLYHKGVPTMGDCRLCGEQAGFLRRVHGECESIRANGLEEMTDMAARAVMARNTKEAQLRSDLA